MWIGNGADEASMEYTMSYNPTLDIGSAERVLKEVKNIFDGLGIIFFLQSGSCLGAVRDGGFIPWDDDVDLLSIIGRNALSEESILATVEVFQKNGFFARRNHVPNCFNHSFLKNWVRIDWTCVYPVNNTVFSYPGIYLPITLFEHPKEVEFLGAKFPVPNPPEEYLRLKYGDEWRKPKKPGSYEIDVVRKIAPTTITGQPCYIRVLDAHDQPQPNVEVVLGGGGVSTTDEQGSATVIIPGSNWYALIFRENGKENVLYMEELDPGITYTYRPISFSPKGNETPKNAGTLGNVLIREGD